MMLSAALTLMAVLAGDSTTTLVGEVRLTRAVGAPLVSIVVANGAIELRGDLVPEIGRLQSAKVEVLGTLDDEGRRCNVSLYRIVDVGGTRPLTGYLTEVASGLALRDGEGEPILLSIQPRVQERLREAIGAKVWVVGKRLVSGELQVQRYGILRDAPKTTTTPTAVP